MATKGPATLNLSMSVEEQVAQLAAFSEQKEKMASIKKDELNQWATLQQEALKQHGYEEMSTFLIALKSFEQATEALALFQEPVKVAVSHLRAYARDFVGNALEQNSIPQLSDADSDVFTSNLFMALQAKYLAPSSFN